MFNGFRYDFSKKKKTEFALHLQCNMILENRSNKIIMVCYVDSFLY